MSPPGGRRLVANLRFEAELAGFRATPGRSALETAAAYGTLLRVFLQPGDRLWLPAPVDRTRLPEVPGLPIPILESGKLENLPPCAETLAWGESHEVARLRQRGPEIEPGIEAPETLAWTELLWRLAPPAPEVVARVHHRAFALEVAASLGCALPGAAMLGSLAELKGHLDAGAAPAGAWVLKAPLSASGRDRYIERGESERPALADPVLRRRIERLFASHGSLLFEPWMERSADFGACALLTSQGLRQLGFHRLLVDLRGQFAGIEIDLDRPDGSGAGLAPDEAARLGETVGAVGSALLRQGYRGPFGLDAWRYRSADGGTDFHPLGEVNARLTFGFVARALAERLAESGAFGPARRFRLEVGGRSAGSDGALPLLLGPNSSDTIAEVRPI